MTLKPYPTNAPERRRTLVVLSAADYDRSSNGGAGAELLYNKEAYVIRYPAEDAQELPVEVRNILSGPGAILLQSPYDANVYEDARDARLTFARDKYMHFAEYCKHLGAKLVQIDTANTVTTSTLERLMAKLKRPLWGGGAEVKNEQRERLATKLRLRYEFAGGKPNIASAEQLLERTGLRADQHMSSLLKLVGTDGNRMTEHRMTLNLSRETESRLTLAANVAKVGVGGIDATYERSLREKVDLSFELLVGF